MCRVSSGCFRKTFCAPLRTLPLSDNIDCLNSFSAENVSMVQCFGINAEILVILSSNPLFIKQIKLNLVKNCTSFGHNFFFIRSTVAQR